MTPRSKGCALDEVTCRRPLFPRSRSVTPWPESMLDSDLLPIPISALAILAAGSTAKSASGVAWRIRAASPLVGVVSAATLWVAADYVSVADPFFVAVQVAILSSLVALVTGSYFLAPLADGLRVRLTGGDPSIARLVTLGVGPMLTFVLAMVILAYVTAVLPMLLFLAPVAVVGANRAFSRLARLDPEFEPSRTVEVLALCVVGTFAVAVCFQ